MDFKVVHTDTQNPDSLEMFKETESYWNSIFGLDYREELGIHAKHFKTGLL